ncbi:MAG: hypothetical protein P8K27_04920 [Gammaproteobacteria bacterium]|nr:hypothetical protein [Gammaproteobacteria bacterium]
MTISELGSIGELVGAIATVATLLYLALQIKANTQAEKYNAIKDIINSVVGSLSRLGDSNEMMDFWTSGTKSFNNLSTKDQVRFTSAATELLAAIEATLETAKSGGIKEESVDAVRAMVFQLMRNPGVREYWLAWGRTRSPKTLSEKSSRLFTRQRKSILRSPVPCHFICHDLRGIYEKSES